MEVQSGLARRMAEHRVADLTWDSIADRLEAGALAVLPIGAGVKEHGFDLPMGTDALQAGWISDRLAEAGASQGIDLLIWPTLTYGYYPAFTAYAGSVSLSRATFVALVREITAGLIGFGAKAAIVLDTGVSTIAPVAEAIEGLASSHHLKIHAGRRYRETAASLMEQPFGSHADELETSRMLVMLPEVVNMSRAVASPVHPDGPRAGALTPVDPASPNYSPSGSFGDPTLATREKGEALVVAMMADLEEVVQLIAACASA